MASLRRSICPPLQSIALTYCFKSYTLHQPHWTLSSFLTFNQLKLTQFSDSRINQPQKQWRWALKRTPVVATASNIRSVKSYIQLVGKRSHCKPPLHYTQGKGCLVSSRSSWPRWHRADIALRMKHMVSSMQGHQTRGRSLPGSIIKRPVMPKCACEIASLVMEEPMESIGLRRGLAVAPSLPAQAAIIDPRTDNRL